MCNTLSDSERLITGIVSYEEFNNASEADLQPMRIHEGTLGIVEYSLKA